MIAAMLDLARHVPPNRRQNELFSARPALISPQSRRRKITGVERTAAHASPGNFPKQAMGRWRFILGTLVGSGRADRFSKVY
jgi:hypothetical protein